MDSAIDRLLSSAAETDATATGAPAFLPSSTWAGPRGGYYFGTVTGRGTGYHLDAADGAAGWNGDGPARKRARPDAADRGDGDGEGGSGGGEKTIRFGADSTHSIPPRPSRHQPRKTGEELLAEAEARLERDQHGGGPSPSTLVLTPAGIARATAQLVRLAERNGLERAAHPASPERFVGSEVALHSAVGVLGAAAADPVGLYPALLGAANNGGAAGGGRGGGGGAKGGAEGGANGAGSGGGAVGPLLSLLAHPNADVAGAVLAVLAEWTGPDLLLPGDPSGGGGAAEAAARNVGRLAAALLATESGAGGLADLLAANLGRFDPSISSSLSSRASASSNNVGDGGGAGGGKDGGGKGGGGAGGEDEEEEADEADRAALGAALALLENLLDLDAAGALRLAWESEAGPASDGDGGDDEGDEDGHGDGHADGHGDGHDGGGAKNGNGKKPKRRGGRGERRSVVRHVLASSPSLLTYLLQRATSTSSSVAAADPSSASAEAIRLHASELLSAILQHDDARRPGGPAADLARLVPYRSAFDDDDDDDDNDAGGDTSTPAVVDGMECLLQSLAPYRRRDPQNEAEVEIAANVADALAASLQDGPNARSFVGGQGVELMLRCLRHGGHGGYGAARVLSFACSGPAAAAAAAIHTDASDGGGDGGASGCPYKAACEVLVEAGGMKQIFPLFMGRSGAVPRPAPCSDAGRGLAATRRMAEEERRGGSGGDDGKKQRKRRRKADAARREWLREVEGNSVRILYELTRHLDEGSPHEAKHRLLAKFLEGDCVSTCTVPAIRGMCPMPSFFRRRSFSR